MSIVIHGVEMPKVCGQCQIKLGIDCELWKHVRSVGLDRHRDCPLGNVTPHGRLIDADALREKFMRAPTAHFTPKEIAIMLEWEEVAPTIIPAEKSNRV